MRFLIRAKPGSRGTRVGGTWGEEDALIVAVTERPEHGKANDAVIELLATVLKTKKSQLQIVSGASHRTKLIEWSDPPEDAAERLAHWRSRR